MKVKSNRKGGRGDGAQGKTKTSLGTKKLAKIERMEQVYKELTIID